jgi:acyl-CoA synthetase (AMP-forming)/AMP-acid ligase II
MLLVVLLLQELTRACGGPTGSICPKTCGALVDKVVCSSGRPFLLSDIRVVVEDEAGAQGVGTNPHCSQVGSKHAGITAGSCSIRDAATGQVGELWIRGPTVFQGERSMQLLASSRMLGLVPWKLS